MADSCPTGAHVGLIFEPIIEEMIQIIPRRLYGDLFAKLLIFLSHFLELAIQLRRGVVGDVRKGFLRACYIVKRMGFAQGKMALVFQGKADFLRDAIAVGASLVLDQSGRLIFASVGAEKGTAAGVVAAHRFVCVQIAVNTVRLSRSEGGPTNTVYRIFVAAEVCVSGFVALGRIFAIDGGGVIGNDFEGTGAGAFVGHGDTKNLALSFVRNEEQRFGANSALLSHNIGISNAMGTVVVLLFIEDGESHGLPKNVTLYHVDGTVIHGVEPASQGILRKSHAEADLGNKANVFVVVEIVIPMTGRFLFGDDEGIFRKMSVLIHDGSFQMMFYDIIIS